MLYTNLNWYILVWKQKVKWMLVHFMIWMKWLLGLVTEYIRNWNKTKTGKYMTSLFKLCGYWELVSLSRTQFLSLIQFIKNVSVDLWYVRTSASNYLNYTIKLLAFYMFLIRNFIFYHCLNIAAWLFMRYMFVSSKFQ